MSNLYLVAVIPIAGLATFSSPADWEVAVDASLMLTQNSYSSNWIGEEVGSISWTFNSNSIAEKQLHAKVHNKSILKLSYGQTYNQDRETRSWSPPSKSTDLIDFESIFRLTLGGFVDPFAAGRIETQFLDARDPTKDRYINPVRFSESFGVAKVLFKEETREWTTRLGGGIRQHLDRGVFNPSTDTREIQTGTDGGIEFVSDFKITLTEEGTAFGSKLTIFQALFYSESEKLKGLPNENYWKSPDINWENTFIASITKYLMVNLYMELLYDKEIDLGARFKETLSLGLTYKLL